MTRRELLEWLSKEDFSLYGECHGQLLDELLADGLVEIGEPKTPYSRVSLTPAGIAALSEEGK